MGYGRSSSVSAISDLTDGSTILVKPVAPYNVNGGKLIWDGTQTTQGYIDTFNQSRSAAALAAAPYSYTVNTLSGGTVTEGASDLVIECTNPHAVTDWDSGVTQTALGLTRTIEYYGGGFLVWAAAEIEDTPAPSAGTFGWRLVLRLAATDDNNVSMLRYFNGTDYDNLQFMTGPNVQTWNGASGGAKIGWLAIRYKPGRDDSSGVVEGLYSNNAVTSRPALGDWVRGNIATHDELAEAWDGNSMPEFDCLVTCVATANVTGIIRVREFGFMYM